MKKSIGARTLLYPTPVLIVGTYDAEGRPNIMNAAWGGICCSKPPCVSVSIRPERHTFAAVQARKAFTVNLPSANQVAEADYTGIVSGSATDKFADCGLTATRSDIIEAPIIEEFPMALECRLKESVELGAHTLIVGEVLDIKVSESALGENGMPDIRKVDPILFAPGERKYYRIGEEVADAFSVGRKFAPSAEG